MDDISQLGHLNRIVAPPDFEERLMARLAERRLSLPRERRMRVYRFSLAGAAAALFAVFIGLNVFLSPKGNPAEFARGDGSGREGIRRALPIMETMDYGGEVRSASSEPRPVYILEQVSYASNSLVKY